jgi:hypothetical protein
MQLRKTVDRSCQKLRERMFLAIPPEIAFGGTKPQIRREIHQRDILLCVEGDNLQRGPVRESEKGEIRLHLPSLFRGDKALIPVGGTQMRVHVPERPPRMAPGDHPGDGHARMARSDTK